ncbi:MAG TPA: TraR/DksA C4-type zinc finger protein [Acidimicrobiales bacterium]|nr:TraR/DksA C4-type zinc finger protein [Acidimicrobiales bacterium]
MSALAVPESTTPDESPRDDDFHRRVLEERRADYASRLDQLRATAADLAAEPASVEAADEEDLGDADGVNVERDRVLALAVAAQRSIDAIDLALARVAAGTYGRCAGCGQPIPGARLEAVPEATHCVTCKSGGGLRGRGLLRG